MNKNDINWRRWETATRKKFPQGKRTAAEYEAFLASLASKAREEAMKKPFM